MIVTGLLVYWRPELILSVVNAETAASLEEMYSPTADSIGRTRAATTDWMMFGYYIRNNVGVAFQCFAAGLFAGLGSCSFWPTTARSPAPSPVSSPDEGCRPRSIRSSPRIRLSN